LSGTDPYDDPPLPLRVVGHVPAHPAGRAARKLGRRLVHYRHAHGLTQEALAAKLGWAQPNLATLDRIARRLGIEVTVRATPKALDIDVREAV
jgi:hypothetical protein